MTDITETFHQPQIEDNTAKSMETSFNGNHVNGDVILDQSCDLPLNNQQFSQASSSDTYKSKEFCKQSENVPLDSPLGDSKVDPIGTDHVNGDFPGNTAIREAQVEVLCKDDLTGNTQQTPDEAQSINNECMLDPGANDAICNETNEESSISNGHESACEPSQTFLSSISDPAQDVNTNPELVAGQDHSLAYGDDPIENSFSENMDSAEIQNFVENSERICPSPIIAKKKPVKKLESILSNLKLRQESVPSPTEEPQPEPEEAAEPLPIPDDLPPGTVFVQPVAADVTKVRHKKKRKKERGMGINKTRIEGMINAAVDITDFCGVIEKEVKAPTPPPIQDDPTVSPTPEIISTPNENQPQPSNSHLKFESSKQQVPMQSPVVQNASISTPKPIQPAPAAHTNASHSQVLMNIPVNNSVVPPVQLQNPAQVQNPVLVQQPNGVQQISYGINQVNPALLNQNVAFINAQTNTLQLVPPNTQQPAIFQAQIQQPNQSQVNSMQTQNIQPVYQHQGMLKPLLQQPRFRFAAPQQNMGQVPMKNVSHVAQKVIQVQPQTQRHPQQFNVVPQIAQQQIMNPQAHMQLQQQQPVQVAQPPQIQVSQGPQVQIAQQGVNPDSNKTVFVLQRGDTLRLDASGNLVVVGRADNASPQLPVATQANLTVPQISKNPVGQQPVLQGSVMGSTNSHVQQTGQRAIYRAGGAAAQQTSTGNVQHSTFQQVIPSLAPQATTSSQQHPIRISFQQPQTGVSLHQPTSTFRQPIRNPLHLKVVRPNPSTAQGSSSVSAAMPSDLSSSHPASGLTLMSNPNTVARAPNANNYFQATDNFSKSNMVIARAIASKPLPTGTARTGEGILQQVLTGSKPGTVTTRKDLQLPPLMKSQEANAQALKKKLQQYSPVSGSGKSEVTVSASNSNSGQTVKKVELFNCAECSKVFIKRESYEKHLTSVGHCVVLKYKDSTDPSVSPCLHCSRVFKTREELLQHMRSQCREYAKEIAHCNMNVVCDYCHLRFRLSSELLNHTRNDHPGLPVKRWEIPGHMKEKDNIFFRPKIVPAKFPTYVEDKNSKSSAKPPLKIIIQKESCEKNSFTSIPAPVIPVSKAKPQVAVKQDQSQKKDKSARQYLKAMRKKFKKRSPKLKKKKKGKHSKLQKGRPRKDSRDYYVAPALRKVGGDNREGKQKLINDCDEWYGDVVIHKDPECTSKIMIKKHGEVKSSGSRPYHCKLCPKDFFSEHCLFEHIKIHTKPFTCGLCGLKNARKDNIMRHIQAVHSGPRYEKKRRGLPDADFEPNRKVPRLATPSSSSRPRRRRSLRRYSDGDSSSEEEMEDWEQLQKKDEEEVERKAKEAEEAEERALLDIEHSDTEELPTMVPTLAAAPSVPSSLLEEVLKEDFENGKEKSKKDDEDEGVITSGKDGEDENGVASDDDEEDEADDDGNDDKEDGDDDDEDQDDDDDGGKEAKGDKDNDKNSDEDNDDHKGNSNNENSGCPEQPPHSDHNYSQDHGSSGPSENSDKGSDEKHRAPSRDHDYMYPYSSGSDKKVMKDSVTLAGSSEEDVDPTNCNGGKETETSGGLFPTYNKNGNNSLEESSLSCNISHDIVENADLNTETGSRASVCLEVEESGKNNVNMTKLSFVEEKVKEDSQERADLYIKEGKGRDLGLGGVEGDSGVPAVSQREAKEILISIDSNFEDINVSGCENDLSVNYSNNKEDCNLNLLEGDPEIKQGNQENEQGDPENQHGDPENKHGNLEKKEGDSENKQRNLENEPGDQKIKQGNLESEHGPENQQGDPENQQEEPEKQLASEILTDENVESEVNEQSDQEDTEIHPAPPTEDPVQENKIVHYRSGEVEGSEHVSDPTESIFSVSDEQQASQMDDDSINDTGEVVEQMPGSDAEKVLSEKFEENSTAENIKYRGAENETMDSLKKNDADKSKTAQEKNCEAHGVFSGIDTKNELSKNNEGKDVKNEVADQLLGSDVVGEIYESTEENYSKKECPEKFDLESAKEEFGEKIGENNFIETLRSNNTEEKNEGEDSKDDFVEQSERHPEVDDMNDPIKSVPERQLHLNEPEAESGLDAIEMEFENQNFPSPGKPIFYPEAIESHESSKSGTPLSFCSDGVSDFRITDCTKSDDDFIKKENLEEEENFCQKGSKNNGDECIVNCHGDEKMEGGGEEEDMIEQYHDGENFPDDGFIPEETEEEQAKKDSEQNSEEMTEIKSQIPNIVSVRSLLTSPSNMAAFNMDSKSQPGQEEASNSVIPRVQPEGQTDRLDMRCQQGNRPSGPYMMSDNHTRMPPPAQCPPYIHQFPQGLPAGMRPPPYPGHPVGQQYNPNIFSAGNPYLMRAPFPARMVQGLPYVPRGGGPPIFLPNHHGPDCNCFRSKGPTAPFRPGYCGKDPMPSQAHLHPQIDQPHQFLTGVEARQAGPMTAIPPWYLQRHQMPMASSPAGWNPMQPYQLQGMTPEGMTSRPPRPILNQSAQPPIGHSPAQDGATGGSPYSPPHSSPDQGTSSSSPKTGGSTPANGPSANGPSQSDSNSTAESLPTSDPPMPKLVRGEELHKHVFTNVSEDFPSAKDTEPSQLRAAVESQIVIEGGNHPQQRPQPPGPKAPFNGAYSDMNVPQSTVQTSDKMYPPNISRFPMNMYHPNWLPGYIGSPPPSAPASEKSSEKSPSHKRERSASSSSKEKSSPIFPKGRSSSMSDIVPSSPESQGGKSPRSHHSPRRRSSNKDVDKPYQCEICKRRFKREFYLQEHMNTHLKQGDTLPDGTLPSPSRKIVTKMNSPNGPMDVVVDLDRPYICHICGKGFKRRNNLADHVRTHSRPYKCGECSFDTIRWQYLADHMRKAHKFDGDEKELEALFKQSGKKLKPTDIIPLASLTPITDRIKDGVILDIPESLNSTGLHIWASENALHKKLDALNEDLMDFYGRGSQKSLEDFKKLEDPTPHEADQNIGNSNSSENELVTNDEEDADGWLASTDFTDNFLSNIEEEKIPKPIDQNQNFDGSFAQSISVPEVIEINEASSDKDPLQASLSGSKEHNLDSSVHCGEQFKVESDDESTLTSDSVGENESLKSGPPGKSPDVTLGISYIHEELKNTHPDLNAGSCDSTANQQNANAFQPLSAGVEENVLCAKELETTPINSSIASGIFAGGDVGQRLQEEPDAEDGIHDDIPAKDGETSGLDQIILDDLNDESNVFPVPDTETGGSQYPIDYREFTKQSGADANPQLQIKDEKQVYAIPETLMDEELYYTPGGRALRKASRSSSDSYTPKATKRERDEEWSPNKRKKSGRRGRGRPRKRPLGSNQGLKSEKSDHDLSSVSFLTPQSTESFQAVNFEESFDDSPKEKKSRKHSPKKSKEHKHKRSSGSSKELVKPEITNKVGINLAEYFYMLNDDITDRPFVCADETCNKRFKSKQHMREHIFTHIKPYKCDICGSGYARTDYLALHMQDDHGVKATKEDMYAKRKLANSRATNCRVRPSKDGRRHFLYADDES